MGDKPVERPLTVAVVDDEPDLRSAVALYLRGAGIDAHEAADAAGLDDLLAARPIDVAVLDIRMPGENGLDLTRRLRRERGIGIVMLTGVVEMADRVSALDLGADDYVTKPFDLRELLARISAVGRRTRGDAAAIRSVVLGERRFDLATGALTHGARRIRLTPKEVALMRLLAGRLGEVVGREAVLRATEQGDASRIFDRAVDARVTRLRRKLEDDPARPRHLLTVLGRGYRLDGEPAFE